MISDPIACDFDPEVLACKSGQSDGCIAPEKIAAIKKAFAGPKNCVWHPGLSGLSLRRGHRVDRLRFRDYSPWGQRPLRPLSNRD